MAWLALGIGIGIRHGDYAEALGMGVGIGLGALLAHLRGPEQVHVACSVQDDIYLS